MNTDQPYPRQHLRQRPSMPQQTGSTYSDSSSRWSGESLVPSNGYSSLFTSGLMRVESTTCLTPTTSIPFPVAFPQSISTASLPRTYNSPRRSPAKHRQSQSPNKKTSPSKSSPSKTRPTPHSPKKRTTAVHSSSPKKGGAASLTADRALDDVMHKLRLYSSSISPVKGGAGAGGSEKVGSMSRWARGRSKAPIPVAEPQPEHLPPFEPQLPSRWSYSSDGSRRSFDSAHSADNASLWGLGMPRKSAESSRSKMSKMSRTSKASKATVKSKRSMWSLRSRKSEEGLREGYTGGAGGGGYGYGSSGNGGYFEYDHNVPVPPLPEPGSYARQIPQAPVTPSRGRRVVEGLARRLGLTPKKNKAPKTPSRQDPLPPSPPPKTPCPEECNGEYNMKMFDPPFLPHHNHPSTLHLDRIASSTSLHQTRNHIQNHNFFTPPKVQDRPTKKGSLQTLRSLAKKTSTGTLRSVKSVKSTFTYHGNESNPTLPTHPPLPPREEDVPGCVRVASMHSQTPTTPRRPAKSSIGPPKAQARVSPSAFESLPRKAPKTPEREREGSTTPWSGFGERGDRRDGEDMEMEMDVELDQNDRGETGQATSDDDNGEVNMDVQSGIGTNLDSGSGMDFGATFDMPNIADIISFPMSSPRRQYQRENSPSLPDLTLDSDDTHATSCSGTSTTTTNTTISTVTAEIITPLTPRTPSRAQSRARSRLALFSRAGERDERVDNAVNEGDDKDAHLQIGEDTEMSIETIFDPCEMLTSTPLSQRNVNVNVNGNFNDSSPHGQTITGNGINGINQLGYSPTHSPGIKPKHLTAKAAAAAAAQEGAGGKPRRLLNLLPARQRKNLGLPAAMSSFVSTHDPTSASSKKDPSPGIVSSIRAEPVHPYTHTLHTLRSRPSRELGQPPTSVARSRGTNAAATSGSTPKAPVRGVVPPPPASHSINRQYSGSSASGIRTGTGTSTTPVGTPAMGNRMSPVGYSPEAELPFRAGAGDGWDTPALGTGGSGGTGAEGRGGGVGDENNGNGEGYFDQVMRSANAKYGNGVYNDKSYGRAQSPAHTPLDGTFGTFGSSSLRPVYTDMNNLDSADSRSSGISSRTASTTTGTGAATHSRRPGMIDFTRRMSDQRAFGVGASVSGHLGVGLADISSASALNSSQLTQGGYHAISTSPDSSPSKYAGTMPGRAQSRSSQTTGGRGGKHYRLPSAASVNTEESSMTAMTGMTGMTVMTGRTAGTAGTGVTGTSLEGEWELERYLRELDE